MTDQELIRDALEQAQLILPEYIEPGAARPPDVISEQLLLVLDRQRPRCGTSAPESRTRFAAGQTNRQQTWLRRD
jgi:hypothetical protein